MNWNKCRFSDFLWLVYAVVAGIGILGIASIMCTRLGYISDYGLLTGGGYLVCAGVLMVCLRKFLEKKKFAGLPAGMHAIVAENIIVIAIFAVGIVMRVMYINTMSGLGEENYFFELAKITEGQGVPMNVHGATYLYVNLLHVVLLLFGNKMAAAVWLQVLLQMAAAVLLHLAVRRLAGRLAAMIMTGFMMCTPYMVEQAVTLSPTFLFLIVYGLVLCILANNLQRHDCKPWIYLLMGMAIGVCCYMDIVGVSLLMIFAGVFSLEREEPETFYNKSGMVFLFSVLGTILSMVLLFLINTMYSGVSIADIIGAWGTIYRSEGFVFPMSLYQIFQRMEGILLMALLGLGIFSYGRRADYERQSIWQGASIVLMVLLCFQMTHPHVDAAVCIYILLAVLAGVGIEGVLLMDNAPRHFVDELEERLAREEAMKARLESENAKSTSGGMAGNHIQTEEKLEKTMEMENDIDTVNKASVVNTAQITQENKGMKLGEIKVENLDEAPENRSRKFDEIKVENLDEVPENKAVKFGEIKVENLDEAQKEEKPKVKYLDNPLPLPKKHVPKTMDYKVRELDLKNTYEYDIAVSDDDDFDI